MFSQQRTKNNQRSSNQRSTPNSTNKQPQAYASAAGGKASSLDKEAFRATLADALQRRLFYLPSFRIYGSVAGFYDYGPPGCAIKQVRFDRPPLLGVVVGLRLEARRRGLPPLPPVVWTASLDSSRRFFPALSHDRLETTHKYPQNPPPSNPPPSKPAPLSNPPPT